ncbi:putative Acetylglutamate kinase [groundwater metagenome]|uniref:Putative Acetylglutamate kinase n=1 Tax=groundwater metagenome TaxID=717931 RepID=A0A098E961_9ZZZZ
MLKVITMSLPDALTGALKYIKKFKGKIFVIFTGKNVFLNGETMNEIAGEITLLKHVGIKVVVVHEIPDADYFGEDKNFISEFVNKHNEDNKANKDNDLKDIGTLSIAGKISLKFVSCIAKQDIVAISLVGKQKPDLLNLLTSENYIPLISPVSVPDQFMFAAELASSLNAEKFIIMFGEEGILDADEELIPAINLKRLEQLTNEGIITENILKPIDACKFAINKGVCMAHLIKADKYKLIEEIFTDEGVGTIITKE